MRYHTSTPPRAAAIAALLAGLTAGCGEPPTADSSNRGSGSQTEETSVENAFIVPRYRPGSCAIQVGDTADLRFTATNNRVTESERLLDIRTDGADSVGITESADLVIPPQASIAIGQPATGSADTDDRGAVILTGLRELARPGTSLDVKFVFDRFGDLTMRVPIEACPTQK